MEAAACLCDGEGSPAAVAERTASTFVWHVAHAATQCEHVGGTTAHAEPKPSARKAAEEFLRTYFLLFADMATCELCEAYASSVRYIAKYVFLQAVAQAEP